MAPSAARPSGRHHRHPPLASLRCRRQRPSTPPLLCRRRRSHCRRLPSPRPRSRRLIRSPLRRRLPRRARRPRRRHPPPPPRLPIPVCPRPPPARLLFRLHFVRRAVPQSRRGRTTGAPARRWRCLACALELRRAAGSDGGGDWRWKRGVCGCAVSNGQAGVCEPRAAHDGGGSARFPLHAHLPQAVGAGKDGDAPNNFLFCHVPSRFC
jgi:hypothetical protein